MIIWVVKVLVAIVCVPFLTLLERKVLSYIQNRKGPNKPSFVGLLQPVGDGIKLIIKNRGRIVYSNNFFFFLFPFIKFFLMLLG